MTNSTHPQLYAERTAVCVGGRGTGLSVVVGLSIGGRGTRADQRRYNSVALAASVLRDAVLRDGKWVRGNVSKTENQESTIVPAGDL